MDKYWIMTVLKEKGGSGPAWICPCADPCLSRKEAMEVVRKYRENWDCLAAWIQLFEDDSDNFRIIYSECNLDEFGEWEEVLRMVHKEAQKIYSAYCNGAEYPFGSVDKDGARVIKDWREAERHGVLLEKALRKQIPEKPIKNGSGDGVRLSADYTCPSCGQGFSGTGVAAYCYHCGQALDWNEILEEADGRSD